MRRARVQEKRSGAVVRAGSQENCTGAVLVFLAWSLESGDIGIAMCDGNVFPPATSVAREAHKFDTLAGQPLRRASLAQGRLKFGGNPHKNARRNASAPTKKQKPPAFG